MHEQPKTIGQLLVERAEQYPSALAVEVSLDRITFSELLQSTEAVAKALMSLGIGPGDVVATVMPNSIEFPIVMLGAVSIGAICLPINARFQPRELAYVLHDSGAKICFTTNAVVDHVDYVERLRAALPDLAGGGTSVPCRTEMAPSLEWLVAIAYPTSDNFIGYDDFLRLGESIASTKLPAARNAVQPEAEAVMLYTSGTTAMPKGCKWRHAAIMQGARNYISRQEIHQGDLMWNPCPFFHTAGLTSLFATLYAGAGYLSMPRFDSEAAIEMMATRQPTHAWPATQTILQALLNHRDRIADAFRSVRTLIVVGPPDPMRLAEEACGGAKVMNGYGLTECPVGTTMTEMTDEPDIRFNTSGRAVETVEIEIRDEGRRKLGAGEVGRLWIRSEHLVSGYHGDPEKTASAFVDGWFDTGDLCSIDRNGRLKYEGRLKDMLKVGGENVSALEIESYLATHVAVEVSAVVGVDDAKYGEVAVAFVQLRPGAAATKEELIEYCAMGLAGFKVPRQIRFVREWPMSASKIQKFKLRAMLQH